MGEINHEGIIKKITSDSIVVSIINQSACSGCHAKGACMAADMKEKEIHVKRNLQSFAVGERVDVIGSTSQGFSALFFGYLFPFILLLITLISLTVLSYNEGVVAFSALGILVPYYLALYFLRDKLKKRFEFEIKSI